MQLHLLFRCCQVLFCFVLFVVGGGAGGAGAGAAALLLLLPLFFDRVSPIHISGEDILLKDQKKEKKKEKKCSQTERSTALKSGC